MTLNDPIDAHLELAKKNVDAGIADDLSAMTVAGILSLSPALEQPSKAFSMGEPVRM